MRLEKEIRDKIKERLRGKVDVQLGKGGLTEGFINEVKSRLEKHRVVKVKILKSFLRASGLGVDDVANKVAEILQARVVDVRGHTFVLVKGRQRL
ncbi:MAG: YhbY family RNA-binding protein [Desulfurococcaceae archaeon]